MPSHFSDAYRQQVVDQYQQLWTEQKLSIDDYASQIQVHQTTVRQWLKKLAPEFDQQRRNQYSAKQGKLARKAPIDKQDDHDHKPEDKDIKPVNGTKQPELLPHHQPSTQTKTKTKTVTVQAEWYHHDTPHDSRTGTDPRDQQIQQLREEVTFLKQQVSYWMRQEAIPA